MITKEEKLNISLYQLITLIGDGLDIADDIYDWVNYYDFSTEEQEEDYYYYNEICKLFAMNIKVIDYRPKYYTICDITSFIKENIKAFTKFMNEQNREDFRPANYTEDELKDDELFYDLYLGTFASLINGYYSEKSYSTLYHYLIGKGE